ncbi:hypothetical protein LNKW23_29020 [Paralimibaculum aggregatum]|uniref:Uncharacterized protein n=1 Tax=Paralimibaculum aggregatum TaxID=3036245 RepID=A0ABQ6LKB5_9RHOB|nr:hypothetical protein LNKW23_29020 [Limibaculum sp. NKW23]
MPGAVQRGGAPGPTGGAWAGGIEDIPRGQGRRPGSPAPGASHPIPKVRGTRRAATGSLRAMRPPDAGRPRRRRPRRRARGRAPPRAGPGRPGDAARRAGDDPHGIVKWPAGAALPGDPEPAAPAGGSAAAARPGPCPGPYPGPRLDSAAPRPQRSGAQQEEP